MAGCGSGKREGGAVAGIATARLTACDRGANGQVGDGAAAQTLPRSTNVSAGPHIHLHSGRRVWGRHSGTKAVQPGQNVNRGGAAAAAMPIHRLSGSNGCVDAEEARRQLAWHTNAALLDDAAYTG